MMVNQLGTIDALRLAMNIPFPLPQKEKCANILSKKSFLLYKPQCPCQNNYSIVFIFTLLTIGRGVVTLLQSPTPIAKKLILLSFVSSNRFQIENRLKFRELPLDFRKFFPINFFYRKISKLP